MRALKVIGLVLAGTALLLAAAAGVVAVGGTPLIAKLIEAQGPARLGREIRLGRLEIDWGAPVRIAAEDVRVANAGWGSRPDMLTARRLEAELDPWALLRMRLVMPRLELFEPVVLLERSAKDAGGNWEELLAKAATPGGSGAGVELRRLVVHQGRITYRDGRTRAETDLAVDDLDAEAPDPARPLAVTAKGRVGTEPFALTAEFAPDELRHGGGPSPVRLDGRLGANTVALSGTAAAPWAPQGLDLAVDMAGRNLLQPLLAMLGMPVPPVPIFRLAGHVRREGARWNLEDVTAQIGNSHLAAASVLIDAGPPIPYVRAELTASDLDLADLKGFLGGGPGPAPPGSGARSNGRLVPDHRLPIETLRALNADISLDAPRVKPSAGLPFERLDLRLSLRDGTLRVRGARLAVAQGELSADLEYRAAADPPAFRADLELRRLDLRTLLSGMDVSASSKRTAGLLGGFARLRSSGATPRKMLAALDGDIGLFLQGGRLGGPFTDALELSVAEALGLVAKGDGPRTIQCFLGRFAVKGGVATADTLLLDTATAVVVGLGNVNLGDETLFLDLKPYPKTGNGSLGNVRVPVSIRGTFAEPKVAADKTGLAERLGAALGLVRPTLPATLLPLLAAGLGETNACRNAFEARQPPARASGAAEGSSTPPAARRR